MCRHILNKCWYTISVFNIGIIRLCVIYIVVYLKSDSAAPTLPYRGYMVHLKQVLAS